MKSLPIDTHVTHVDRFGLMLFFAVSFHMLVILGVTFNPFAGKPADQTPPTMDITLVMPSNKDTPEQAEYLAQVTQKGGGNRTDQVRATRPPVALDIRGSAGANEVTSLPRTPPGNAQHRLLTQDDSRDKSALTTEGKQTQSKDVTAAQLIMRSEQIASLSAEIDASLQARAKRPKERFITASTHELRDASYMEAWRDKVERIGNLNYPEEAKQRKLSGSLVLDVAIRPDGSIDKITVRRSSGYKLLDDAAVRIVKLAAPFAPFPEQMRKDTDILHITKTWQFLSGNQLHM